jgi:tRNA modification GTPase
MAELDTIVATSTPTGRSALAVVRIDGPLAPDIIQSAFGRKTSMVIKQATTGIWCDIKNVPVDQVVALLWAEGKSFTGSNSLEITCHGNPLIVRRLIEDCMARGCRMAEPGEFTRRAFLAGKLDLTQAEAVADLIHASSERALTSARRMFAGEMGKLVAQWTDRLLQTLAILEAHIDFPEEDIPPENPQGPLILLSNIASELYGYAASSKHDSVIKNGLRVAIVGSPNAGKSSLVNVLSGTQRALVSDEPGTTRDFLEAPIAGLPLTVTAVDTAGLRNEGSVLEKAGMARSLEQTESAHFIILVVDASTPPPSLPDSLLVLLNPSKTLVVKNKSDLPEHAGFKNFLPDYNKIQTCLLDDRDAEKLRTLIGETLISRELAPGAEDLVVSVRHAEALKRAAGALTEAVRHLSPPIHTELAATHCREALDSLGKLWEELITSECWTSSSLPSA